MRRVKFELFSTAFSSFIVLRYEAFIFGYARNIKGTFKTLLNIYNGDFPNSVNGLKPFATHTNSSIILVCQGSEWATEK